MHKANKIKVVICLSLFMSITSLAAEHSMKLSKLHYEFKAIYESLDNGNTWKPNAAFPSGSISAIAINPNNPSEIYAT